MFRVTQEPKSPCSPRVSAHISPGCTRERGAELSVQSRGRGLGGYGQETSSIGFIPRNQSNR